MKLTIIGATGFLGSALVRDALAEGHEVSVLARTPEKLGDARARVRCVAGDAISPDVAREAVAGADAVVSTIAPSKTRPGDPRLAERAFGTILEAMRQEKVGRLVHVGGAGYQVYSDEEWSGSRRFLRFMLMLNARKIMEAKRLEWGLLKEADLDWTLVRPPAILARRVGGSLVASERRLEGLAVERDALSRFILGELSGGAWIRKAPLLSMSKAVRPGRGGGL